MGGGGGGDGMEASTWNYLSFFESMTLCLLLAVRTSELRGRWEHLPLGHMLVLEKCFEGRKGDALGKQCAL